MENESCLNRIIAKSESQNATVTERKIALYIKENLEKVLHCNLLELAELIGVSDASMVRFCKSLGYKGFHTQKSPILMSCPGRSSEKGHFILFFSILASYLPLRNHILNRTGRSQLGSGLF